MVYTNCHTFSFLQCALYPNNSFQRIHSCLACETVFQSQPFISLNIGLSLKISALKFEMMRPTFNLLDGN